MFQIKKGDTMKKVIAIMVVLMLLAANVAFAADAPTATATAAATENTAMTKLGRGLMNVVAAIFEIPTTMMQQGEADGVGAAVTKGPVLGIVNTVVRALVGVYEVATFPVPVPENYEPILDAPEILGKQM